MLLFLHVMIVFRSPYVKDKCVSRSINENIFQCFIYLLRVLQQNVFNPFRPESHRVGDNRKRSTQSTNTDQKSLETVFLIAICRQSGDKCHRKRSF